jgi:L-fucose isomerase-like protein
MGARKKTTIGLIVGTRGFFNVKLAAQGRKRALAQLRKAGCEVVVLPVEATPSGAVETVADAAKCAALFSQRRADLDGVVVTLPNFGDELGIVNTLSAARLDVPVLVHAEDDDNDKVDVAHRRDAFCGKLAVCANLYQYGIKFSDTTFHTEKVDGDVFGDDLAQFVGVCRVVRGLRGSRIGAIGARPGAFQSVRVSEKILQASGITVVPVDLSEILAAAAAIKDGDKALKAKVRDIKTYGTIAAGTPEALVARQAKLGVAIERWVADNGIDAAAVQCWTSVQNNYGCAACLSMSMLGNRLLPAACEVDVAGAVSMYALTLASGNASALLDWNNNYGQDDRDLCVATHCSSYPADFIGARPQIGTLDVLGNTLGREKCFGAVKGKVRPGPMTFFRISTDDCRGAVKAYLGEGEFTNDPYAMDGGIAVCRVDGLQQLLKYMCKNGFEHHVGMARGHVAKIVEEAVGNYLGWDLYVHE